MKIYFPEHAEADTIFSQLSVTDSRSHFSKCFWAHHWNLVKIQVILIMIPMIRSGHNFAHAITAQMSCDMCEFVTW